MRLGKPAEQCYHQEVVARAACLMVSLLLAGGCVGLPRDQDQIECRSDAECAGECTRTGQCVAEGESLGIYLLWTVHGAAPSPDDPTPCDPIAELEVAFFSGSEPGPAYSPVPCSLGQITYDKMPPHLNTATISALGPGGRLLDSASAALEPAGDTRATLDLQP